MNTTGKIVCINPSTVDGVQGDLTKCRIVVEYNRPVGFRRDDLVTVTIARPIDGGAEEEKK